jgi:hypothetical protein
MKVADIYTYIYIYIYTYQPPSFEVNLRRAWDLRRQTEKIPIKDSTPE